MKLCITCLARTDMTPRPGDVVERSPQPSSAKPLGTRGRLDSIFDYDDDEIPTTLTIPAFRVTASKAKQTSPSKTPSGAPARGKVTLSPRSPLVPKRGSILEPFRG